MIDLTSKHCLAVFRLEVGSALSTPISRLAGASLYLGASVFVWNIQHTPDKLLKVGFIKGWRLTSCMWFWCSLVSRLSRILSSVVTESETLRDVISSRHLDICVIRGDKCVKISQFVCVCIPWDLVPTLQTTPRHKVGMSVTSHDSCVRANLI